MIGKVTFIVGVIKSAILKTLVRDRFILGIVIHNEIFNGKRMLTLL